MSDTDTIEKIGRSQIQFGPYNDRIYVMKYYPEDREAFFQRVDALNAEHKFRKIFVKTFATNHDDFASRGYTLDATAPNLYGGSVDGEFWGLYRDDAARVDSDPELLNKIRDTALSKPELKTLPPLEAGMTIRRLDKEDTEKLAALYRVVFESYPFPIHDPAYLAQTMDENFIYFGVFQGTKLVAASSCEMDEAEKFVEMTDFATDPAAQGKGFATYLLDFMEEPMRQRGIRTAFTIARAHSFGVNIAFAKLGYKFGGTLINNTNIMGKIESMNVWTKPL